jgi:hypothetical protein
MRYPLICLLCLAAYGCASTDVAKMDPVELCYTKMVDEDNKAKAEAEVNKRRIDCNQYAAQIKKMHEMEQRAGQTGGEIGDATPKQGGGMLNKGY